MNNITDQSLLTLASHVKLKTNSKSNECFLLAPEKAVRLNKTAAVILSLCKESVSYFEIKTQLSSQFGDSFETDELQEFISDVVSKGWLQVTEK